MLFWQLPKIKLVEVLNKKYIKVGPFDFRDAEHADGIQS